MHVKAPVSEGDLAIDLWHRSAIDEYTRALESEMDEYQVAYLNRGMAHEILGEYEAAEADYREALALAPGDPVTRAYRRELRRDAAPSLGGRPAIE